MLDRPESLLSHLDDLRSWCRSRSRDRDMADDIVQETLLIALTRIDTLRDPNRLRGWLYRVAQRRMADFMRRRRTLHPLTFDPLAPAPAPPPDPDQAIRVRRAVRRLPLFLRRPVRLHYLKGKPLSEVARTLDTTVNGIKSRLYRARRILREEVSR